MEKISALFWKILTHVTFFCFVSMLTVMVFQVLSRDIFKISVSWTDEATRYFFIWAIFLGSALAQRRGDHIRITILIDRFPPPLRKLLNVVIDLFSFCLSAIILIGAIKMMISTYGIFASTIPISFTYIYLALASGIAIMLILILKDILNAFGHKKVLPFSKEGVTP